MGAYEWRPAPCPADHNRDGGVDGSDISDFFADWQAGRPPADIDLDGGIDGNDVIEFFVHWERGC